MITEDSEVECSNAPWWDLSGQTEYHEKHANVLLGLLALCPAEYGCAIETYEDIKNNDTSWRTKDPARAWDHLLYEALHISAAKDDVLVLREVIRAGMNVSRMSICGSALFGALRNNCLNTLQILIENGVDPDAVDQHENTPLIRAAAEGTDEAFELLLTAKPKLNEKDKDGNTALMYAAAFGHVNRVKALIKAGAELHHLNSTGRCGRSALLLALEFHHFDCACELVNVGATLHHEISHDLVELARDHGVKILE